MAEAECQTFPLPPRPAPLTDDGRRRGLVFRVLTYVFILKPLSNDWSVAGAKSQEPTLIYIYIYICKHVYMHMHIYIYIHISLYM